MHEDPIALGLVIFFVLAAVLAVPLFLTFGPTRRNHDRRHAHHSELMCDYCRARYYAPGLSAGEALTRWPYRVLGDRPPRGTG